MKRGDVMIVHYPFASGIGSKLRPALVVQCDHNNQRLTNVILAAITSTTHRNGEPTQLLIEFGTPAGQQSGLVKDSVVTCENLVTITQSHARKIGKIPADVMLQVDDALRVSLALN